MIWINDKFKCIGFSETIAPFIQQAINDKQVDWLPDTASTFVGINTQEFNWIGCRWEVEEVYETVTSIRKIDGILDDEALTYLVLKG